ncbi:MAG: helix-turn-helix transcriptional regulator [Eggerthellaceae bacterium]|nr:helix-turn-helix transcriptional regulator [Eggerthellaceae bacterium]
MLGATMNILDVFGDNVRKYRLERQLSQEVFAEKCGLHRTYISAVERHKRSISLNNIQKIANALEIETYKLFLEPGQDKDN